MNFSEAVMVAINHEIATTGHGLTGREAENLGMAWSLPRRTAREIFASMIEQRFVVRLRKRVTGGKREMEWQINPKLLRAGSKNNALSENASSMENPDFAGQRQTPVMPENTAMDRCVSV